MRTAATFKMLPDPAFVVSWLCFVCHSCPCGIQLWASPASAFVLCLLLVAKQSQLCNKSCRLLIAWCSHACNAVVLAMLVCTELRLDISCNLLLGYTVLCVIIHASLLPANSYFVKECQVNRITQSLCPDVGTLAPHLAKAVHKAWEKIKTASALLQTNRLQLSNAGLVKAPPHRSTQAAHPQQLTSKC